MKSISYLSLVTAILIAAVSAWFSIAGLVIIFSSSVVAIAIMAAVLEIGKLVTASWLYRNWHTTPVLLKTYLTTAVVLLMFISSLGIFGFLSGAHIGHTATVAPNQSKIARIDLQIEREQRNIAGAEKVLNQLDQAIDVLINYDKISGPTGALAQREAQTDQRNSMQSVISQAQTVIDQLEEEKLALRFEIQTIETEVGPVKYLADMLYGSDENGLDRAVRLVIIIIVVVFDPLAVLLLVAANHSMIRIVPPVEDKPSVKEPIAEPVPTNINTVPEAAPAKTVTNRKEDAAGISKLPGDTTKSVNTVSKKVQ